MSGTVGVLVADDSTVFLAAAVAVVEAAPGFAVAGACGSLSEAVEIAQTVRPGLALVDASLAGVARGGVAAIYDVSPDTRVILLSADPERVGGGALDKADLSPALLKTLWVGLRYGSERVSSGQISAREERFDAG